MLGNFLQHQQNNPVAAAQRITNLVFGGVRAKAVRKLKMKNGRKTPYTPAGGQSCCPLLWDSPDRKQYHNRANPHNSRRTGGDPLQNPYMDILSGVSSQKK